MDLLQLVRDTTAFVVAESTHVTIDEEQLVKRCADVVELLRTPAGAWDDAIHYRDPADDEKTARYLFVLDAMNFCFWPAGQDLEYDVLSLQLRRAAETRPELFEPVSLEQITPESLSTDYFGGWELPNAEERCRLLREVGFGLRTRFGGRVSNMIEAAGRSASKLASLITETFYGFRDHCIYKSRQIFYLKRVQIFIGDLYGCFGGAGLGAFDDVARLTMFADYRVPQILRDWGVLVYSDELAEKVDNLVELPSGGEEECEIRAGIVQAIERMKSVLATAGAHGEALSPVPHSIKLDWVLWSAGEQRRFELRPHHRTRTIFY